MIYNKEDDIEHLIIILKSPERVQTYEIPLLNDESETVEASGMDYKVKFSVSSKTFNDSCSMFQKLGCENIIFSNPNNSIIIKSTCDMCSTQTLLQCEENADQDTDTKCSLQFFDNEEEIDLQFSLAYIHIFSKLHAISNKVNISLSQNFPILFQYEFSIGEATFYVAPKIED